MQTKLADFIKDTPEGEEADSILRACVHCGFCNATCPTYQLLGDELDGPRGRIYLIKEVLEGGDPSAKTQLHLDRCLTCRACETTCPSGVRYGRLADIGRQVVDSKVNRPLKDRAMRRLLRMILPYRRRIGPLLRIPQLVEPVLPTSMRARIPGRETTSAWWPALRHRRRMLILDGCVQPAVAPSINIAAARVLDRLGISVIRTPASGCCGALSYHLTAQQEGLDFMRRNIDAWWPYIEQGVEAIVMTASGCGVMVKDYGELLKHDADYATKAERVASLTKDISELIAAENLVNLADGRAKVVAYQSPCTLWHGQQLKGCVEKILESVGFRLANISDAHLCCGSAGTYSLLQGELSKRLLVDKVAALRAGHPEVIATANIGCLVHLKSAVTEVRVCHWIELLDDASKTNGN